MHNRCLALGVILALVLLLTGCASDKPFREKQARAFRDRGERYLAENQTNTALEQFLKALEIYPEDPYLHYDLALTYDMNGLSDAHPVSNNTKTTITPIARHLLCALNLSSLPSCRLPPYSLTAES